MKYNLADPKEAEAAFAYLTELVGKDAIAEVIKVSPKRSLNQNNYLHLLLGLYAMETGHRLDEAKTIYKRDVNPDIYVYEKNGSKFLHSSADLDTAAMTKSIDHFREWAGERGIELPTATDQGWLRAIENDMERQRQYL